MTRKATTGSSESRKFRVTVYVTIEYHGARGASTGDAAMVVSSALRSWKSKTGDDPDVHLVDASLAVAQRV